MQTIPRAANSAAVATVVSRTSDTSAGWRWVLSTVSPDSSNTELTRAIKAGSVVPRSSSPVPNGALPSSSTNCRLLVDGVTPGMLTVPRTVRPAGASGACPRVLHTVLE